MSEQPAKLITFPPSSDCENSRWMMSHYGLDFQESAHAPPFFILALWMAGSKLFPTYIDKAKQLKLQGPPAIFGHFDPLMDDASKLVPDAYKDEVMAAWNLYNKQMGVHVVVWAYGNLLPHKDIMIDPLSLGAPWYERLFTRYLYFIPKNVLWKTIDPTPVKIDESLKFIQQTFAGVSEKLADGRRYLVGDRFTLADMAFAVSGAPLVLPLGYGGQPDKPGPIPTFEQWPTEQQAIIREMQESLAGKFILCMYQEERYRLSSDDKGGLTKSHH